jgi:hypothetical protein
MAGISGQGTTFNLPNYTGELLNISPEDTPFLSAIGGLTGGEETTATEFEWQTHDLREPEENRSRLEGANAQTADARVRANVTNVVEIHQETVEVSYTKQAAVGNRSGANIDGVNPVTAELPWQIEQALKAKATDVESSFLLGQYHKPSDNSTARKTRGLLQAITTNVIDLGTLHSGLSATTDSIAETSTTLADGDAVRFTDVGASTAIKLNRVYYVVGKTTNAFKVSATKGGSAITIGTATVSLSKISTAGPTKDTYDTLFQKVFDNGGMRESATQTIIVGSRQKRNLSEAYARAYGKYQESSRNVGGVNFTTIMTDFGTFNVLLDRWMPADVFAVVSLEQCSPVFLRIPEKGHFFEEPLAKVGASDRVQIYGEVGLKYGNEKAHGVYRGLPVEPVWS